MEVFSTREVSPSRRLAEWNNRVCERLTAVDIDAPRDFVGTMRSCQIGHASVATIKGQSTVVQTSRDGFRRSRAVSRIGLSIQEASTARFSFGAREQLVGRQEFVLLDLSSPYRAETGEDGKAVTVIYLPSSEVLAQCPNAMDRVGAKGTVRTGVGALLHSFARTCLTHHQGGNELTLGEMLANLVLLVLDDLSQDVRQVHTRDRVREEAIRLIDQTLCDPDLSTQFIADRLGVTPRYIQMVFADITKSPSSYIRMRRLDRAKEAVLKSDGRKISDIAFDVGFSDLSQFNRSFKARFGTTPSRLGRFAS